MTADPPYHYLHSLEGGLESSKVEWACLHVGRHRSCHWPGHTCEMLSTTIMCIEAIGRLGCDRRLQVICIPVEYWDYAVVDFSSPECMDEYPHLAEHLWQHKIKRETLNSYAARFREVVIDLRAVRSKKFKPKIFEIKHNNPIVDHLRVYCSDANEFMHAESLALFEAERNCRKCIASWLNPRSSFRVNIVPCE